MDRVETWWREGGDRVDRVEAEWREGRNNLEIWLRNNI